MEFEMIKEFLKPELLVIIPVCYFIGAGLVNSKLVKNEHIPLVLGCASVVFSATYVLATSNISNYQEVLMAVFTAFTQGILMAGCSVYVDQLLKQAEKSKKEE